ncbi:MAG: DUF3362 domain-containing protein, partial [Clostridia bacterium]|nr:DUF3362 domain-containing protein [Clostridia bacterium]
YDIIVEALKEAGRQDLIGFGEECLVKPTKEEAMAKADREHQKSKSVASPHNKKNYNSSKPKSRGAKRR